MLINIILANFIVSLISFVGLFFFIKQGTFKKRSVNNSLVSFAAGVMLSAAFVTILPEALEQGDAHEVLLYALLGMIFGFLLERFLLWYHHHHEDTHSFKPTAWLVLIGDSIHNFIDGLAIAATYIVNPGLGFATTIAIAAHEIPQEFADFSILLHCGLSKKKAIIFNFLSALTAIIGGIVGFYLLQHFAHIVPLALGVAAGIFIYVSAADLIPELHRESKGAKSKSLLLQAIPFLLGTILMMFISQTYVHSHEDSDDVHEDDAMMILEQGSEDDHQ